MNTQTFFPRALAGAAAVAISLAACGPTARSTQPVVVAPAAQVVGSPIPEQTRTTAVTFAVWSSRTLPSAVARTARALDGVVASGTAIAGTVELRAVGGDARFRSRARLSTLALDPEPLGFDPSFTAVTRALKEGYVAVNAVTAKRRDIYVGDTLYLRDTMEFRVGAVFGGNSLFEHELVVPLTDAKRLGMTGTRAVIVAVEPAAVPDTTEALIDAAGGAPAHIRPLQSIEEPGTVLDAATLRKYFGSFPYVRGAGDSILPDPRWVRASIVEYKMPVLGWVRCHRNMLAQLYYALHEIQQAGLAELIETYDGCYVPRFQRLDDTTLSAHAYGIAVDINAAKDPQGAPPTMDPRIVSIMERWGFAWGGYFKVPDGHHFEIARIVSR